MHALTRHRLLFPDSAECPVQGADSHACSSCSASKVAAGTQPFTLKTNFSRAAAARIARISPRKGRLASARPSCQTAARGVSASTTNRLPFQPQGTRLLPWRERDDAVVSELKKVFSHSKKKD